jgi:ribosomal protein L11 methyltransferase
MAGVILVALPVTPDLFGHTGRETDAPILVAEDLCVRPPWVPGPAGFAGIELVVPRGVGFGSGEHGSTRAALAALHGAWPQRTVARLVDVGTGSGILAAYGRARGALAIVACDIELDAVRAARDLVSGLAVVCGGPEVLAIEADIVVANMTAAELEATLASLRRLCAPLGLLVVSGLRIGTPEQAFTARATAAGLAPTGRRVECEGFAALVFTAAAASSLR